MYMYNVFTLKLTAYTDLELRPQTFEWDCCRVKAHTASQNICPMSCTVNKLLPGSVQTLLFELGVSVELLAMSKWYKVYNILNIYNIYLRRWVGIPIEQVSPIKPEEHIQ